MDEILYEALDIIFNPERSVKDFKKFKDKLASPELKNISKKIIAAARGLKATYNFRD